MGGVLPGGAPHPLQGWALSCSLGLRTAGLKMVSLSRWPGSIVWLWVLRPNRPVPRQATVMVSWVVCRESSMAMTVQLRSAATCAMSLTVGPQTATWRGAGTQDTSEAHSVGLHRRASRGVRVPVWRWGGPLGRLWRYYRVIISRLALPIRWPTGEESSVLPGNNRCGPDWRRSTSGGARIVCGHGIQLQSS